MLRGFLLLWRGDSSSPECTLPPGATAGLFTKHMGGVCRIHRLPAPVPRKPSQETGCRLHGMSQMCSVCRHFPGIHVPLAACHRPCVTHAPRNGEGEKLEETALLETASPLPRALKHWRTFILNFGSDVLRTPIFSFLWARWCSVCKGCFLRKDHWLLRSSPGPVSGSCMFLNPL